MPVEMRPEMLSLPRGIRLNELFAYLGGKVADDSKLFLLKRVFECRQFFSGHFQMFLEIVHFSALLYFVIITNSSLIRLHFVIVTNSF